MAVIDLRSDTVTRPSQGMRAAMMAAPVGDDVYGEDPTVNRLEQMAAALTGTEAALFAASGTQSNLLGLLAQCGRGDEYIVGQQAHTYRYEGGGAAVLGSIQPQPLELHADGTFDLEQVRAAVKPDDVHFARSRLLALENTHNGRALPLEYLGQAHACAREHQLRFHLDGARLCNAAIHHQLSVGQLCQGFDSVSLCLSKGLGAPVGSLLCADQEVIAEARRWRKMLGGGMRQAGILAAAGIHALEHQLERLAEDHAHAADLARGLVELEELAVEYAESQTNMVFVTLPPEDAESLPRFLGERNIRIPSGKRVRLVTHLDIDAPAIQAVIAGFKAYYSRQNLSR
ncbi:low-specificity L-threonine aldolase [Desulfogranum mediterraneum]|uniref:low-specificity L-threonine aldolase n=1 Tax=Desulfogranum mediterraneum TaxID=160661 RepID=UPI00040C1462|nr:low-specificity L-threonine aldolase [Desulfogranum mediterraneum]